MNDVYPYIVPMFFGAILIAAIRLLWVELTREIEPYSEGD